MRIPLLYLFILLQVSFRLQAQTPWFRTDTLTPVSYQGKPLLNPWAGGLNAGQFSKMHLNNDGVEDLVVFDRTNNKVTTFLADPATKAFRYAPAYEARFPFVQNWMLLVDYDQDGHKDLFTHTPQGVQVYRQELNGTSWTWKLAKPLLYSRGFSGRINLLVSATDIPALTDVDDDGDLDIVTFEMLGHYAEMHQNMSMEKYGVPDSLEFIRNGVCWGNFTKEHCNDFQFGLDCGSLESLGSSTDATARVMHSGDALLLLDLNGDGKKDMLLGHVTCNNIMHLVNQGTNRVANYTSFSTTFPAKDPIDFTIFPALYLEDVDFDGVKDLLAAPNVYANEGNLMDFRASGWYYHNNGTATNPDFVLRQKGFLQDQMIDVGENAAPAFFDVDGDGDLDLFIGTGGVRKGNGFRASMWYLRNVGTAREPRYEVASEDYLSLSESLQITNLRPQWADFNGDGVPDLGFAGVTFKGTEYRYMPNRASRGAAAQLNAAEAVTLVLPAEVQPGDSPYFYDVDRDGDLDLIVGKTQGNIAYYLNTGTARQPVFQLQTDELANVSFNYRGRFVSIGVEDINLDGQPDLLTTDQSGTMKIFHSGEWGKWSKHDSLLVENPVLDRTIQPYLGTYLYPAVADYNGDGKPDLAIGTNAGGLRLMTNILPVTITAPEPGLTWRAEVFPSPAVDYVYITTDTNAEVEVYNLQGITMLPKPLPVKANQEAVVDIQNWVPGLYIFRISNTRGVVVKKVLVR
ncbi:T9SS type A sorting domain-containing protein [Telluribacter humicola]|uniref:T9SS type A sorting domain-containing protein n=1 Tax=Telluribacter humicola TaxID=1720261 RepID=UPI001A968AC6|nr:T9SS type A sorting domain-containing protein [Telluribacter humicola]